MPREVIWTQVIRRWLYEELVQRFGAHSTWKHLTAPNDTAGYRTFLDEFAEVVGANSGDAVRHQINFALQRRFVFYAGAQNSILNKAAAFEAGFLSNRDFCKIEPPDYPSVKERSPRATADPRQNVPLMND